MLPCNPAERWSGNKLMTQRLEHTLTIGGDKRVRYIDGIKAGKGNKWWGKKLHSSHVIHHTNSPGSEPGSSPTVASFETQCVPIMSHNSERFIIPLANFHIIAWAYFTLLITICITWGNCLIVLFPFQTGAFSTGQHRQFLAFSTLKYRIGMHIHFTFQRED